VYTHILLSLEQLKQVHKTNAVYRNLQNTLLETTHAKLSKLEVTSDITLPVATQPQCKCVADNGNTVNFDLFQLEPYFLLDSTEDRVLNLTESKKNNETIRVFPGCFLWLPTSVVGVTALNLCSPPKKLQFFACTPMIVRVWMCLIAESTWNADKHNTPSNNKCFTQRVHDCSSLITTDKNATLTTVVKNHDTNSKQQDTVQLLISVHGSKSWQTTYNLIKAKFESNDSGTFMDIDFIWCMLCLKSHEMPWVLYREEVNHTKLNIQCNILRRPKKSFNSKMDHIQKYRSTKFSI